MVKAKVGDAESNKKARMMVNEPKIDIISK